MHENSKFFNRRPAYILLKNGMRFDGYSFGAQVDNDGELVFQTGMTGYVESLTDPSYKYQIMVLTYPLIGNCGVSTPGLDEFNLITYHESDRIHCSGLVVGEYSEECNHWNSMKSLSEWLIQWNIPAICGIDTRHLTKYLSENGSQLAKIICNDLVTNFREQEFFNPNLINLNDMVSVKTPQIYNPNGKYKIAALDFGIKINQMRLLSKLGAAVHLIPWDYNFDIKDYDGLFLSNGPGDPMECVVSRQNVRKWITSDIVKPVFGICYGHQVLGLAAGFYTYKMPYGNRGLSVPCTLYGTKRCFMTTQNHGFAVGYNRTIEKEKLNGLDESWDILFLNENDGSNEGIIHKTLPYYSVQFHPEHMAGPKDVEFLFDFFIEAVEANLNKKPYHLKNELYKRALTFNDNAVQPECFRPKKLLVLGSGALSIGQAAEFDYSGSQAIKAFKEENVYVVLINPNVATFQTSKDLADKVYFLPITIDYVTQVIKAERPDAISLSFGGSTALNCGLELHKSGILSEYKVKVLGTTIETVLNTEDRELFANEITKIGEKVVPSEAAYSVEQALEAAARLGYPVMVRAAYALGGLGSAFAHDKAELTQIAQSAFTMTNQILVDKSLKGWKEVEFEVMRDNHDNCVTVCSMENVDPLGIHTGESIVCVPCQTLSNEEFYMLRQTALKVIRRLGIVGECNIQYALSPNSLEHYIIEVNAFTSRSSALASKATGYPLAYMAAKLSLGLSLVELKNSVTDSTTACFEPALDYCVIKMPRWDLKKFKRVSNKIGSSMKSVGEVMAIGRDFEEAFQKALRMIDDNNYGFDPYHETVDRTKEEFSVDLEQPTDRRIFVLASAIKSKLFTADDLSQLTGIDKWFLYKFMNIIEHIEILENNYRIKTPFQIGDEDDDEEDEAQIRRLEIDATIMSACKRLGFSDKQIALYVNSTELEIRRIRKELNVLPFVKQMDTISGEYPAHTNYLYVTYNGDSHDLQIDPSVGHQSVVVIGSGVYRIGSSVEYDWCSVSCLRELKNLGYKTIMINYNPSTVSTDYDMSDKLYFEELSFETVMNIYELENPKGLVLSMGGQSANNIALNLHLQKVKVLGTSPVSIDNAENRFKFSRLLDNIGILQPPWRELQNLSSAIEFCEKVGYPCLVRPSYVLSGASMRVVYNNQDLIKYIKEEVVDVSKEHPVVITKFIQEAKELDVDAVAKDGEIVCMALASHIEDAGVHSGDSTLITPPIDIDSQTLERIKEITGAIASALQVNGPFNIQIISKDNQLQVIECNLRASRSFPFVSKTLEVDLIAIATQASLGIQPQQYGYLTGVGRRIGVKVPQFSFGSLTDADVLLGVEMVSTGEVACFGENMYEAYLKALLSTGFRLPQRNILLSIGSYKDKVKLLESVRRFDRLGFKLYASSTTADFYCEHDINVEIVDWSYEDHDQQVEESVRPKSKRYSSNQFEDLGERTERARTNQRTIADYLIDNHFDLIVNIPMQSSSTMSRASSFMTQGYYTRRMAVNYSVPLITNIKNVKLLALALEACHGRAPPINTSLDCLTSVKWVKLPGLIDVHVALKELCENQTEHILRGTSAALAGGFTQVCIRHNDIVSEEALSQAEQAYAQYSYSDYGFYVGASSANASEELRHLESRALGLQMDISELKLSVLMKHFTNWPSNSIICCNAECTSLAAILFLSELYDRHVHVSRISTLDDINLIKLAKDKGLKITCDAAPHHLFLSKENAPGQGFVGLDLKDESDRQALWDNIDSIDIISSDRTYTLELTLTLMLTACRQGRISLEAIIDKLNTNPRRIFNLPEQRDCYIEAEIDCEWTVPESMPFSQLTPFTGMKVNGKVHRVTLHGEVVYVDGNILIKSGCGKNVCDNRPQVAVRATIESSALKRTRNFRLPSDSDLLGQENRSGELTPAVRLEDNQLQVPRIRIDRETTLEQLTHATNGFFGLNLVNIQPLNDHHKLHDLFNLAHNLRTALVTAKDLTNHLRGKILAEMFYEQSTRTQCSFASAMQRLGGSVIYMNEHNRENLVDTIRMMSSYADCLVFKHSDSNAIDLAVTHSNIPVINAGDENPTQALFDIFTIREEIGHVNGITITMCGDLRSAHNVHALAKLFGLYKEVTVQYVTPFESHRMPKDIVDYLNAHGVRQVEFKTIEDALPTSDVLYMGYLNRKLFKSVDDYKKFQVTPTLMRTANERMIVMHTLPRGDEIHGTFDTDPRAAYLRQAEYSLDVRMALLLSILKGH